MDDRPGDDRELRVTDDAASARERLGAVIGGYRSIPSYEAMLEREGVADAVDVAIIGDADEVGAARSPLCLLEARRMSPQSHSETLTKSARPGT
jgi:hypothetical protein